MLRKGFGDALAPQFGHHLADQVCRGQVPGRDRITVAWLSLDLLSHPKGLPPSSNRLSEGPLARGA